MRYADGELSLLRAALPAASNQIAAKSENRGTYKGGERKNAAREGSLCNGPDPIADKEPPAEHLPGTVIYTQTR